MAPQNFESTIFNQAFRLRMLEYYFNGLEAQLPAVDSQTMLQLKADLEARGVPEGDEEYQITLARGEHHTRHEYPMMMRAQVVVAAWALIEASINDAANTLQRERQKPLALKDIDGRTPRQRQEKYFAFVLEEPLEFGEAQWRRISDLTTVRNDLVHSGGIPYARSDANIRKLKEVASRNRNLTVGDAGVEGIEASYVSEQLELVKEVLLDLGGALGDDGAFRSGT